MTSTTDTDGTEDVNDFLTRIRELGEKRDKEDEDRTKKLEEEILKGRKERQARRAGNVCFLFLELRVVFFCGGSPRPRPTRPLHGTDGTGRLDVD